MNVKTKLGFFPSVTTGRLQLSAAGPTATRVTRYLLAAIAAIVAFGVPSGVSSASPLPRCHAPFKMPRGYPRNEPGQYYAVIVLKHHGMTCSAALHMAACAYMLPGLEPIWGPQFGAGGFGGPFQVGRFHCYLLMRGSDFRVAKCSRASKSLRFIDSRDFTAFRSEEPGWSGPLRTP